jgi:hypothetical protein
VLCSVVSAYVCVLFVICMFVDVHVVYVCGSVRERRGDMSAWQSRV